jgi:hypothetical protein
LCDLLPGLPKAYADPTRLRQIMLILIDNALRFTRRGGIIEIRARLADPESKFVMIEVSDTGPGIPPEDLNRVFERLYQVRETNQPSRNGLGLGLFICQGLVARQGGRIWVESKADVGTNFSFTLPIFSLNNLIAPLFADNRWPAESVALVVVEVWLREESASRSPDEYWTCEAHRRIQRCLTPNLDVLLQQIQGHHGRQQFFVAAFSDEQGIAALCDRIRGQLCLPPLSKKMDFSISDSVLKAVPPEPATSMENAVNSMASHLDAAIKSQIPWEAVSHERQENSYRRG